MIETDHAGPAPAPPPEVRHEPPDENYRTILITAGILVATAVVIQVAMYWMFAYFKDRENEEKKGEFPLAVQENQMDLSERLRQTAQSQPLLEGFKRHEQEGYAIDVRPRYHRPSENERLQSYGPADPPDKGYVSIPIDAAMRLMLEKNRLPVQKDTNGKAEKGGP
jgi:hypothetical protein